MMEAAQLALRGRAYLPESPGGEYSRNADDDSGKSGITPKIFDVVIGRRDNDEERQLGGNES